MGMFDDVNFKMNCPNCGQEVDDFQSKDRECTLSTLEPDEVNNFYTHCHACGTWIEFTREPTYEGRREKSLTLEQVQALGFVMTTEQR